MNKLTLLIRSTMFLLLIWCFSTAFTANTKPIIKVNTKGEVTINDVKILDQTLEEVEAVLQEADRSETYPNGETSHFYDNIGIVITEGSGKIKALGINYNWDGDEKFPKTSYTGSFAIGKVNIDKNSSAQDFKKITVLKYSCPGSLICLSSDEGLNIRTMVAFKDGKITQWAVLKK